LADESKSGLKRVTTLFDEFASQVLEIKIVLTGVFYNVGVRYQARLSHHCPRLRIDLRVINCHLNIHVSQVPPPKTLGDV